MKNKTVFGTIVVLVSLFSINIAMACVFPPTLEFNTHRISFDLKNYRNATAVRDQLERIKAGYEVTVHDEEWCIKRGYPLEKCPRTEAVQYDFTDIDMEVITKFIINGYSVIKQTTSEYGSFLKQARMINSDPDDCRLYRAVAHKNGWTGYILDRKEHCPIPKCTPISFRVVWNDLGAQVSEYPQITDQQCDANTPCPERLECFDFPGIGLRCAEPNPCSYFECPKGTQCSVTESYPGQVVCSCVGPECPAVSRAEETVKYNLLTRTVVHVIKKNETVSRNISLWKTSPGNMSLLETALASAECSNELVIEGSKIFMETSMGKKSINLLPEDAISVSETPNIESVKKVELKEESQKPVYSVKGTKQARLLFLIPISLEVETKVDAESGNVISVNKPWWSFLAW